jgi:hypothetical protein
MSQKLCALYVRCALSVLQKECRKVSGARYTLGARYLYFKRKAEKFRVRVIVRCALSVLQKDCRLGYVRLG